MRDKLNLTTLKQYVDGEIESLHGKVDSLVNAYPSEEDVSDIRLRSEAVKEATIRSRVIGDYTDPMFVDNVLKIAAFLMGENFSAPVYNFVDQYRVAPQFPEDVDLYH